MQAHSYDRYCTAVNYATLLLIIEGTVSHVGQIQTPTETEHFLMPLS